MKVSIPDIFIHFFCSKKRHLKMFKSIEKYLKILTTYKIFSIEGTRPDTQHKLFAVIVSACQKKRPTDGQTDTPSLRATTNREESKTDGRFHGI